MDIAMHECLWRHHHADLFTYNLQSITCLYVERYVSQYEPASDVVQ